MDVGFGSFFGSSLTFMVALLFLLNRTGYCNQDDYNSDVMMDTCHFTDGQDRTIDLSPNNTQGNNEYGTVTLTSGYGYPPNLDCDLRILAPPDSMIFIRITRIDVYRESSEGCYPDQFTVIPISGSTGFAYCGYGVPADPISSDSRAMALHFRSGSWSFTNYRIGFRLYYNTFRSGTCDQNTEFRCWHDSRCIPLILKCDGLDNCGDWSDEVLESCGLSTGAIIAIAVSCTLAAFCIAAFIFYYFYNKKKDKERERNRYMQTEMNQGYQVSPDWPTNTGVPVNMTTPTNATYAMGVEPPPPYTHISFPGPVSSAPNMPIPVYPSSAGYANVTGLIAAPAPVAANVSQPAPATISGEGTVTSNL